MEKETLFCRFLNYIHDLVFRCFRVLKAIPLSLIALLLVSSVAYAAISLYDYHDSDGATGLVNEGNGNWGQSFNCSSTINVTYVDLYVERVGSSAEVYTYVVSIRNLTSDNFSDGGQVIASDTAYWMDMPTSYSWMRYYPVYGASNNVTLTAGEEYMISCVSNSMSAERKILWWGDSSLPNDYYENGSGWYGATNDWDLYYEGDNKVDLYFKVYGTTSHTIQDNEQLVEVTDTDATTGYPAYCDSNELYWQFVDGEWLNTGTCDDGEPDVVAPIIDDIDDALDNVLSWWGADTLMGRVLVSFILMAIVAAFTWRRRTICVVATICTFAFCVAGGWIPIWIVVLLGLIASLLVWGKLKAGSN